MIARTLLLASALVLGTAALPAQAGVSLSIEIGVPPPPLRVEAVPPPRHGYVWAPGYWRWDGRRHVWIAGHWMVARAGYRWVPERWDDEGHHHYRFAAGHWEQADRHYERAHDRGERGHGHDHDRGRGPDHGPRHDRDDRR